MDGTTAARLARDVAGASAPGLAAELEAWVAGAPRVRTFVEDNGPKIRRKVRAAADSEALRDVRAELLVAVRLLADRRMEVAFEAYGSGRGGPDFTVTFRGGTTFNVEVTRRRGTAEGTAVADAVVAKLRQLPPSVPNVLVVAVESPVTAEDVGAALRTLRARIDARDEDALARTRASTPRDFYERFLRLNAVVAWAPDGPAAAPAAWTNGSARVGLDSRVVAALAVCLAGPG